MHWLGRLMLTSQAELRRRGHTSGLTGELRASLAEAVDALREIDLLGADPRSRQSLPRLPRPISERHIHARGGSAGRDGGAVSTHEPETPPRFWFSTFRCNPWLVRGRRKQWRRYEKANAAMKAEIRKTIPGWPVAPIGGSSIRSEPIEPNRTTSEDDDA